MKYAYEITMELPKSQTVVVKYLPDSTVCTPDEMAVRIPILVFDIEDVATRANTIHELILASAPLESWENQRKEAELLTKTVNFSLAGLSDIASEGDEAITKTLRNDPRTTTKSDWTDGVIATRAVLKANKGAMTKKELGEHLRKFVEDENFELSPKKAR
jgi:hypothetical protein